MPNFVQVGQAVPEIWPFIEFFKMAAVRHLGFSTVGNSNCPCPSEVQNASSYQIVCRSIKVLQKYDRFRFFKMAAVRHLGFLKVGNFNCPYCDICCVSVRLCPSVCPPQAGTVPKRLNAESRKQRHAIAQDSSFLMPKISAKFQRDHPQRGRQIHMGRFKRRFLTNVSLYLRNGAR